MASLILRVTPERSVLLLKSVTSIGRGPQNDVRIPDGSVEDRHAHVLKDRSGYRIFATDGATLLVNGKKRSEWALADGDRIELGKIALTYREKEPSSEHPDELTDPNLMALPVPGSPDDGEAPTPAAMEKSSSVTEAVPLEAFKKLYRFSAKITGAANLEAMERNLVDAVIELVEADTGFLIIIDPQGSARIEFARSRKGEDLPTSERNLSDSIVDEVLKHRRPVLISDAMESSLFSESLSVVNYKLRSVIAVPILFGDELLGALYLGCNRKSSAFSPEFLDVLAVFSSQAGLLVKNGMLVANLQKDNAELKQELESRTFGEIVGGSTSMQTVFKAVSRFAPTDISALILGETGTGKELIAREIHRHSTRAKGPFVAINMSAIPENLLEAELFGYVKGAFTGAVGDRRGKLSDANGGTLFLDEIGDMPLALQAKLLRVLQERQITPLGSNKTAAIDCRVVSATHQDLEDMQERGTFRADLYFRLNEVTVTLPPLRERGEDIPLLATYFLAKYSELMGRPQKRRFTPQAMSAMKRYRWRGNVRELEARIKKAVVMAESTEIDVRDLDLEEGGLAEVMNLRDAKEAFALRYIREVLELNANNRSKTARDLGVDPRTIYKYLEGK